MGLLLQLFVVTTFVAVLHGAPTDQHSESTTVGIRPLPATLGKKDDSKESSEDKSDAKRVSRETPASQANNKDSTSTTVRPQFGSRPVRDTTHFISGVPTPNNQDQNQDQNQNRPIPQTYPQNPQGYSNERRVRDVKDAKAAPPPPGAHSATQHRPLGAQEHKPTLSGQKRPVRETNNPSSQAKVQTRPAPLPAKVNQKPGAQNNGPTNRRVRDVDSSSSSTTERHVRDVDSNTSSTSERSQN